MKTLQSKYCILKDKNLIIEYHLGVLTATSYIQFKTALAKDPFFNPNFNFIIYLKDTIVKATENNVKKYEILAKQKLLTSVSKSEFIKKKKYHDHKAIFYSIHNSKEKILKIKTLQK